MAFELTSLDHVENDAELGDRTGNEPSLEVLFDFALLIFVIGSNSVQRTQVQQ